eukprot:6304365-Pyramimonas_sp.AAC.1
MLDQTEFASEEAHNNYIGNLQTRTTEGQVDVNHHYENMVQNMQQAARSAFEPDQLTPPQR